MDGFEEVAATLYSLEPGDFVAARDSRAKDARGAGDPDLARRIAALRRPSAAAWTVNQLVREHPEEMEQLLELGVRLRAAQDELDGDELRELNLRRHAVLAAVLRRARAEAADQGHPLSDAVARQVESTLRAALADPVAAAAVRSGLLVRELAATGLGGVDVGAALAIPEADLPARAAAASSEPRVRRSKDGAERRERGGTGSRGREEADARRREREVAEARRRERDEARRAVEEAEAAAARADRALEEAQGRVRELGERRAELAERVRDLTRRLQEARAQDEEAAREEKRVRAGREGAAREARAAEREAARARTRRDQLG